MPKFKINYVDGRSVEEIEADEFVDEEEWIEFNRDTAVGAKNVLRVRANDVDRIEVEGARVVERRQPRFKIHFVNPEREAEEFEADEKVDEGNWIELRRNSAVGSKKVLRVRAGDVSRIERLSD